MIDAVETPLVFDIVRGSFADGPGIRTVIFLKGCPLNCVWCHNPESISTSAQTFFYPECCIQCGDCEKGKSCASLAKRISGKYYSPEELVNIILKYKTYYKNSGGGVTFSGGEPLIHINFLSEVSEILNQNNIQIAIETCGDFNFNHFEEKLLPFVNHILYDIKIIDPMIHKQFIGKSNKRIIENLTLLLNRKVNVLPRIPLIPEYTATEKNLAQIAALFQELNIQKYDFLSYNPSGIDKLQHLQKHIPENISHKPMSLDEERRWTDFFDQQVKTRLSDSTFKVQS